jgi:putative phosphoesterase
MAAFSSESMIILAASDIHGNPFPLQQVLRNEKFDVSLFLGDLVDYGPLPAESIDLVRQNFDIVIQGNHDYAASNNTDCLCGQENHELSVYTREHITMPKLGSEDKQYLKSLPPSATKELDGLSFDLSHGSPSNRLYGYMYPWQISSDSLRNEIGRPTDSNIILVGHTHYQFYVPFSGRLVLNPGSIGQPRDTVPFPSYAVINTQTMQVELKRVKYDTTPLKNGLLSLINDQKMLEHDLRLFRLS